MSFHRTDDMSLKRSQVGPFAAEETCRPNELLNCEIVSGLGGGVIFPSGLNRAGEMTGIRPLPE